MGPVELVAEEKLMIRDFCQTTYGKGWERRVGTIKTIVIRMIYRDGDRGGVSKLPEINRVEFYLRHIDTTIALRLNPEPYLAAIGLSCFGAGTPNFIKK